MLNKERIILMTAAAGIEKQSKRELDTYSYGRKEYVVSHFLKIVAVFTLFYIFVIAGIAMLFIEEEPARAQSTDWLIIGMNALAIYIFLVFFYAFVILIVYSIRYDRSMKTVRKYNSILRQIDELYDDEERQIQMQRTTQGMKKLRKKTGKKTKDKGEKA